MKKIYLLATALAALVSCTSDEFVGDDGSSNSVNNNAAIRFTPDAGRITRATSITGTAAERLDNQFRVYGVKSGATAGSNFQKVFPDYGVWYANSSAGSTTSNSSGWEYVEPSTTGESHGSSDNPMSLSNQSIKYWDHSAADYRFVAGSPYQAFTFNVNSSTNVIESATVTGLAGHISPNSGTAITANPIYVAKPLIIAETDYSTSYGSKPVTFTFISQQSRVRVGVYETIPGYKITNIQFYPYSGSAWGTTAGNNIVLASTTADYFVGATSGEATITYVWSGSDSGVTYPYYTYSYSSTGLSTANNWYAGLLNASGWEMATTSSESTISKFYGTDSDMDANSGYFPVIPTPSATVAAPLLIKCDYTLTSEVDGSGETITVHGATAAVPAAFSKWAPNTSYTYLFKISDNTNGKTNPSLDPVGIFPITFDAVTVTDATTTVGYTTTVSTPSITTYQDNSVTTTGVTYNHSTAIYFTVQDNTDGTLKVLNTTTGTVGCVKVYWLGTEAKTEADLQIIAPTNELSASTPSGSTALSLPNDPWNHNGQNIAAQNYGTFTPGAAGYYAIQYVNTAAEGSTPASYTYKIVYVQ